MAGLLIFVFGLCIGSFINCLVYRLYLYSSTSEEPLRVTIRGVLGGRSYCDHCKRQIAWHDNIPLLSFIFLGGKCRYCHSPIPLQYPLVELITGLATLFVVFHLPGGVAPAVHLEGVLFYLLLTYALIAIFVSDLNYQTIPDEIVYPAMILVLLANFFTSEESWPRKLGLPPSEVSSWLVALGAAGFFLFLVLVTKGKGMGMGDVKLAGLMGLILGFPKIIVALYLAFLTGALIGVILVLIGKKKLGSRIPFGPFLTGATLIVLFWGEGITIKILRLLGQ